MRTALITVAHRRHDHLRNQQLMLQRSHTAPDLRVVVATADPAVMAVVAEPGMPAMTAEPATEAATVDRLIVVDVNGAPGGLPVAAARNAGARAALRHGADLLVFLDVDCLPSPTMLGSYVRAAGDPNYADALLCGPVAYLPATTTGYDFDRLSEHPFHPARPAPPAGVVELSDEYRLFWSLSFAVTAATWRRLGGFCEQYVGYGAEDTDLAMVARQQRVDLAWVGGADAYHQWHPAGRPPIQHLDDILRNGALFASRWGWWPMQGWLDQFAELGLIRSIDGGAGWERVEVVSSHDSRVAVR